MFRFRRRRPAISIADLGSFLKHVFNRFLDDRCLDYAGSLTFATMLTFVPVMAITLSVLAQFPVFDDISSRLYAIVVESFMPDAGTAVLVQIETFTENTGKLSALSAVGLTLAVFLLLLAIDSSFNSIWHVTVPRPFMWRLLAFWTVLTLGPILLGMSLLLSGYLFATAEIAGLDAWAGPGGRSTWLLPPVMEFVAFTLLYGTIPNRPVKARHALSGAAVATVLFEVLKKGYGFYVTAFPTYQTIYGALAVIPITMVWIYLAWSIGLLGAVVAASLADWRAHRGTPDLPQLSPGVRLTVALSILSELRAASVRGEVVERKAMLKKLRLGAFVVETVLRQLDQARYITQTGRDRWVLGRDLDEITLYDLYRDLNLGVVADALKWLDPTPWQDRAGRSIASFDAVGRECMAVRLKELFAAGHQAGGQVIPFGRDKR